MFFHTWYAYGARRGEYGGFAKPPSPIVVPDFAHHDGYDVLYCPAAK